MSRLGFPLLVAGASALLVAGCSSAQGTTSTVTTATPTAIVTTTTAAPSPTAALSQTSSPTATTTTTPSNSSGPGAQSTPGNPADFPWPDTSGQIRACDRPQWPTATAEQEATSPGHGRRVLVIGDSLTREAGLEQGGPTSTRIRHELSNAGWVPTIVCWGGKQTPWALEQISALSALDLVPDRVVIGLGTNDLFYSHVNATDFAARVSAVLDALAQVRTPSGNPPQVYWVNQWVDKDLAKINKTRPTDLLSDDMHTYEQNNEALAQTCTPARHCTVVDWHAVVAATPNGNAEYVDQEIDGIHLSPAGLQRRAETIVHALGASTS